MIRATRKENDYWEFFSPKFPFPQLSWNIVIQNYILWLKSKFWVESQNFRDLSPNFVIMKMYLSEKNQDCLGLPQPAISSCGCASTPVVHSLMCSRATQAWVLLLGWWICNTAVHAIISIQECNNTTALKCHFLGSWLQFYYICPISLGQLTCWELHFRPISPASSRLVGSLMHINFSLADDWVHFSVNMTVRGPQ